MGVSTRLSWASPTRVFLLRPTGSHGKQLSRVGLHVCDLHFHKDPWLRGRGREAIRGHYHSASERGPVASWGLEAERLRMGEFQCKRTAPCGPLPHPALKLPAPSQCWEERQLRLPTGLAVLPGPELLCSG